MAQTQWRSEHDAVEEQGQHGSSRAGAVLRLLLLEFRDERGVATSSSSSPSSDSRLKREIFVDLDEAAPAPKV